VQARAAANGNSFRLTVVAGGANPQPSAEQLRELRRLLLASAPPSLAGVLQIVVPRLRHLRIDLTLNVDELDHAGELAKYAKHKMTRLFDTAAGGVDGDGWALGQNPSGQEIALALIDAPHLDGIDDVVLWEITGSAAATPWPATLAGDELAVLADDPVRIEFRIPEVVA